MSDGIAFGAIGLMLLVFCYQLGLAPDAPPAAAAEPPAGAVMPQDERIRWAYDLALRLGNSAPTAEAVAFIAAWEDAENTAAAWNPIATSQDMPGATRFNSDGVKNYLSREDGIEASAITLGYSYSGYADILAGIKTNDPQRALAGLAASPWGTNAADAAALYPGRLQALTVALVPSVSAAPAAPGGAVASNPIGIGGDAMGINVRAALDARSGALRRVTIAPGETWSFNATIGNPDALQLATIVHAGDGWCNLAARYAQVARAFGADLQFLHHNVDLGAGPENDVLIWNIGGLPGFDGGREDLLITNTHAVPLHFGIQADGEHISVVGWEG